jgi:hypothetical protein
VKGFPLVAKALYDMELFQEAPFIAYYDENKFNKENKGHSLVRKQIKGFVEWLKEDNDSTSGSSDSGSD